MKIYCCNCQIEVEARLTNGKEIYPHREDLFQLPFWKCDSCNGKVGCHHKTKNKTAPLGVIPSPKISKIRSEIHKIIDPIWKAKIKTRKEVYQIMSDLLGLNFHSATIRTEKEAYKCLSAAMRVKAISNECNSK